MASTLSLLILGLLLLRTIQLIYRRFYKLQGFKGPALAAYSRLWLGWAYSTENSNTIFASLNSKYGKFVRIGPNHLLTDDPEVQWRILAPRSRYLRGPWFDSLRLDPHLPSIASERDTKKHDLLRAQVSAGYKTRDFPDLELKVDGEIAAWSRRVRALMKGKTSADFDFARSVRTANMEISAHICFSRGMDLKDDDKTATDFWESLEEAAPYGQYISVFGELFRLLYYIACVPWLKARVMLVEGNNAGIGHILKCSRLVVEDRFREAAKPTNDMLGSWMAHGLTQQQAQSEVCIALVTSAFPIAVTVNVLALYIGTNPIILRTLRSEIDHALRDGAISTPPTDVQLEKLPFLQACIDEAMRIAPPIVQLRDRLVPPEGDMIDGIYLPGGTAIGFNITALLRHACFGPKVDDFRPERWLEQDEVERLAQMRRIHALLFGYGGTRCLGITQARMVVAKFIFELFLEYDVQVLRPESPWISQCNGVFFHRDFQVRITTRLAA